MLQKQCPTDPTVYGYRDNRSSSRFPSGKRDAAFRGKSPTPTQCGGHTICQALLLFRAPYDCTFCSPVQKSPHAFLGCRRARQQVADDPAFPTEHFLNIPQSRDGRTEFRNTPSAGSALYLRNGLAWVYFYRTISPSRKSRPHQTMSGHISTPARAAGVTDLE